MKNLITFLVAAQLTIDVAFYWVVAKLGQHERRLQELERGK